LLTAITLAHILATTAARGAVGLYRKQRAVPDRRVAAGPAYRRPAQAVSAEIVPDRSCIHLIVDVLADPAGNLIELFQPAQR
jgi:hypothetical protein